MNRKLSSPNKKKLCESNPYPVLYSLWNVKTNIEEIQEKEVNQNEDKS